MNGSPDALGDVGDHMILTGLQYLQPGTTSQVHPIPSNLRTQPWLVLLLLTHTSAFFFSPSLFWIPFIVECSICNLRRGPLPEFLPNSRGLRGCPLRIFTVPYGAHVSPELGSVVQTVGRTRVPSFLTWGHGCGLISQRLDRPDNCDDFSLVETWREKFIT